MPLFGVNADRLDNRELNTRERIEDPVQALAVTIIKDATGLPNYVKTTSTGLDCVDSQPFKANPMGIDWLRTCCGEFWVRVLDMLPEVIWKIAVRGTKRAAEKWSRINPNDLCKNCATAT